MKTDRLKKYWWVLPVTVLAAWSCKISLFTIWPRLNMILGFALSVLYGLLVLVFALRKDQSDPSVLPARGCLWGLSLLFAVTVVLGLSFHQTGSTEWLMSRKKDAAIVAVGLTLSVPVCITGFWGMLHPASPREWLSRPRTSLLIAGALLICWLPWAICVFPGTVTFDANSQVRMIYGVVPMSNANPIAQTGLLALMLRLGEILWHSPDSGVALYCISQAVLMAWLLGTLLKRMAVQGAGRGLLIGSFCFLAFCPAIPTFAFCVGKDTNFGMAVLFFSMETWEWLRLTYVEDPPQKAVRGNRIRLIIAAILCTLLRNAGAYLVLLTLVVCMIVALIIRKKYLVGLFVAVVCTTAVMLIVQLAVLPLFHATPTPESENLSLPLQQCVRCAISQPLTQADTDALEKVMDLKTAESVYNAEMSDRVKDTWREDATKAEKSGFYRTWLSLIRRYPMTCFSATFHNTYGYFMPGYMSTLKAVLFVGDFHSRSEPTQDIFPYTVNEKAKHIKERFQKWAEDPVYCVIHSPGLYSLLTLVALLSVLRKGKLRKLPAVLPAVFVLTGCVLSAVNGYLRYALPLLLCAPFLLHVTLTTLSPHDKM